MKDSWQLKPLGELLTNIQKGKISEQSEYPINGFIPVINTDTLRGDIKVWGKELKSVVCKKDDVLILWDGERSGLCAIGYSGIVGSTFAKMSVNFEIDPNYLYRFLDFNFPWIQNQRTGTGVPHVPKDLTKILKITYPPLPQQRKIAEILSTCDEVIEKTEAAIAKYRAIKQGMMHDLFTRGIDIHTGILRPKYEDAPDLYQESDIGMIPKEWEVKELAGICKINGRVGWKGYTVADLRDQGPLTLGAGQIDKHNILDLSNPVRLCYEKYLESPEIIVKKGDLLIVQRGTIGKYVLIETEIGEATINPSMVLLNNIRINSKFLYYSFGTDTFSKQIVNNTSQTGVPMISQAQISSFKICVPKELGELKEITEKLFSLDRKLRLEIEIKTKYSQIKAGLMQDLLSGKVGVKVDEKKLNAY
jgi:type I restriction enzyme S subunit